MSEKHDLQNDRHDSVVAVSARQARCYVWQTGRFAADEKFWVNELGPAVNAAEVKGGKHLRFFLSSGEQLRKFKKIVETKFDNVEFIDREPTIDGETEEVEGEA